ncbi:MAG: tyrosine-type recombinase/integrase [Oligoflexia bacterium]|nr:tyrosine-type recombinase/integrase [Oligoflexia bacterium]
MREKKSIHKQVQNYFQNYLPNERGLSMNSIYSYRDTLKLLFMHVALIKKKKIKNISEQDITADIVIDFLNKLEKERDNSISTRNQRLAVIKTFFSYMIAEDFEHSDQYQKILAISNKKEKISSITYLSEQEIDSFFKTIDKNSIQGIRDYAIFLTLYNSGARVQELCDLRFCDVKLVKPYSMQVTGKGKKTRIVPLWERTTIALKNYYKVRVHNESQEDRIFLGKKRTPISRFGILYLVKSYLDKTVQNCESLRGKKIGVHTFRHTTAMHLLQSGVDISVIKSWLGHVDLNTTNNYVEINMEAKEKALGKIKKSNFKEIEKLKRKNENIVEWLEAI